MKEVVILQSIVEPVQQNCFLPENLENHLAARLLVSGLDVKWVLYEITIIGEVVKRLSTGFRDRHSGIEWRKNSGMRDRLVHDYDEVKLDLIWEVIKTNIPELLDYITLFLPAEE